MRWERWESLERQESIVRNIERVLIRASLKNEREREQEREIGGRESERECEQCLRTLQIEVAPAAAHTEPDQREYRTGYSH